MINTIEKLSSISGYSFKNTELALQALTHSSYAKTHHIPSLDNERLEYLGDAVLELSVSDYLYFQFPNMQEGEMTRSRSLLVREESLFKAATRIGLNQLVRMDEAEEKIGGREKPSIISDAFEALIAAIYIDGGYDAANDFIKRTLLSNITAEDLLPKKDPKTLLQEQVQAQKKNAVIKYELIDSSGPDHKKLFRMAVFIDGVIYGEGFGYSKRAAGESAASAALSKLCLNQEHK